MICPTPLLERNCTLSVVAWMQRIGIQDGGDFIAALGGIVGDQPGFRLRLHPGYAVGLGGAPVLGEAAGGGSSEDRLAELLDDGGYAVEAVAASVDAGQQGV